MVNNLPNQCAVEWCTEPLIHTRHEAVLHTWAGGDPNMRDLTRWLQLIMYAHEPRVGPLVPELALTISGSDLRKPDRVSVTLTRTEWAELAGMVKTAVGG